MNEPCMSVDVAGIRFPNPILSASGTFGFGEEFSQVYDLNLLGGLVTKSLRLKPWKGNPPPRVWEAPCGLLNSVGIPSEGYDHFARAHVPFLKTLEIPIIISIAGHSIGDFVELAVRLNQYGFISAIEANVSCPNLERGGKRFDDDKDSLFELVQKVKEKSRFPLFIKLSPASDIVERAVCAEEAGADALVVANAILGMAIDVAKRRPVFANVFAGLSGPAVKPIILRMVWQVAEVVNVPIVACGGVITGRDALEYLMAGAKLVEVGTANFVDLYSIPRIARELKTLLKEEGFGSVNDVVNCARR